MLWLLLDEAFALAMPATVTLGRGAIPSLLASRGARGLAAVKACGGLTAVQDPQEAAHAVMPQAAIRAADPEFVLPLAGLRGLLHTVTHR